MTAKDWVNQATYNFYSDWQELKSAGYIDYLLYDGISAPNKNILTIKFYYNNKLTTNNNTDDMVYCYLHINKDQLGDADYFRSWDIIGNLLNVEDIAKKIRLRIMYMICDLQSNITKQLANWRRTGHSVTILEAEPKQSGLLFIDFN